MMNIKFSPTFDLGHVFVLVGGLITAVAFVYKLDERVSIQEANAATRWESQKQVDARQDQRIDEVKSQIVQSAEEVKEVIRQKGH